MKVYKAHIVQEAEGCDYTIGCGLNVIDLDSKTLESAKVELIKVIKEYYTGDNQLEHAELYEINEIVEMDLDMIYKEVELEDEQQELNDREEQERKEYDEVRRSQGYVETLIKGGFDPLKTWFGRQVVIRN